MTKFTTAERDRDRERERETERDCSRRNEAEKFTDKRVHLVHVLSLQFGEIADGPHLRKRREK